MTNIQSYRTLGADVVCELKANVGICCNLIYHLTSLTVMTANAMRVMVSKESQQRQHTKLIFGDLIVGLSSFQLLFILYDMHLINMEDSDTRKRCDSLPIMMCDARRSLFFFFPSTSKPCPRSQKPTLTLNIFPLKNFSMCNSV